MLSLYAFLVKHFCLFFCFSIFTSYLQLRFGFLYGAYRRRQEICENLRIEIPYLCINNTGQMLPPNLCSHHFRQAAKKVGLKGMRLHDLRHTVVTYMLDAGENPKTVQEFVGHADPSFMLPQVCTRSGAKQETRKRYADADTVRAGCTVGQSSTRGTKPWAQFGKTIDKSLSLLFWSVPKLYPKPKMSTRRDRKSPKRRGFVAFFGSDTRNRIALFGDKPQYLVIINSF